MAGKCYKLPILIGCVAGEPGGSADEHGQHKLKIGHRASPLRASWGLYNLYKAREDLRTRRESRCFECACQVRREIPLVGHKMFLAQANQAFAQLQTKNKESPADHGCLGA